jgi:acyl carrier protein
LAVILVQQLRLPDNSCLTPDARLEDAGLDSLAMLSFIASIEREFDVSVSDRDYETLETFGDALALVDRLTR